MLLLLLLSILLDKFIRASVAAPLGVDLSIADVQEGADSISAEPDKRTITNITLLCLSTTFTCTWVSVHPNIPFFGEGKWSILGRKFYLMFLSLIAPELMVMWACNQWIGAKIISRFVEGNYKEFSQYLTLSHSCL